MMRKIMLLASCIIACIIAGPAAAAPRNILLILADDYGIDVTRYYPTTDRRTTTPPAPATPKLAALAQSGLLFRNAWAEPSCSPRLRDHKVLAQEWQGRAAGETQLTKGVGTA